MTEKTIPGNDQIHRMFDSLSAKSIVKIVYKYLSLEGGEIPSSMEISC